MRAEVKAAIRPLVMPLIRRFDLIYGRIGVIEANAAGAQGQIGAAQGQIVAAQHQIDRVRAQLDALRGSNENLTRAWLSQEAEIRDLRAGQTAAGRFAGDAGQLRGLLDERMAEIARHTDTQQTELGATQKRVDDTLRFLRGHGYGLVALYENAYDRHGVMQWGNALFRAKPAGA